MKYLRTALVEQGVPIPPEIRTRDEVVAWVLGFHLRDCVIDRRSNGAKLDRLLKYLGPDMARDEKAKAVLASIKNFFDGLTALLRSRGAVGWVRLTSAIIMLIVGWKSGGFEKMMDVAHALKTWLELFQPG